MLAWKRAIGAGFLSWAVPFALSFLLFPLKRENPPLFATLMMLIVLAVAVVLLRFYFRGRQVSPGAAACVGAVWLALNLACDYPMFAYGPMKMTAAAYYSEIGLVYLVFPLFGFGAARLER